MSGGGSRKTKVAPPDYQVPYLKSGLNRAEQTYQQGAPVAPFSQDSVAAQNAIRERATNPDPTIGAAQNYVQNSLNGGFLNANPYIDATYNRAAQASQAQLASQFAGSGRNVDASEGNRAQQLNDLANQVYGGNYANERQLMQGTLQYAQPLGNQAYIDANALSASGAQQEAKTQEQMDAPGKALDDYLRRITTGNFGSTATQTEKGDPLTTAAGTALTLGGMFGQTGAAGNAVSSLGGLFGSGSGGAAGAAGAAYPGINGAVSIPGASPFGGMGSALGGFGGAAGATGAAMGGVAGGNLAAGGLMSAAGANAALGTAAEAGMASANAALGGAAAGGSGVSSALMAAAPWAAGALAAAVVIAKNIPDKSKFHDDIKFTPDGSAQFNPAQTWKVDGQTISGTDMNAVYGPVFAKFAQTGNFEESLAAMPQPSTPGQQAAASGKVLAQMIKGTGNPFRNISMKLGLGKGVWSEGFKGRKDAIKSLQGGTFGPRVGISNPAPQGIF